MRYRVLLVDDEAHVIDSLKRALRKEPYEILGATSAEEALDLLARETVDVIVSDEKMPGMAGSEFLSLVCRRYPETIRMMLTGHANLDTALRAINQGEIYRLLLKPCNEVDLAVAVRQALERREKIRQAGKVVPTANSSSRFLQELEDEHPGITKVKKDPTGAAIIEDPEEDFETLLKEIEKTSNEG